METCFIVTMLGGATINAVCASIRDMEGKLKSMVWRPSIRLVAKEVEDYTTRSSDVREERNEGRPLAKQEILTFSG